MEAQTYHEAPSGKRAVVLLLLAAGCVKAQPIKMATPAAGAPGADAGAGADTAVAEECPPAAGAPNEACRELLARQEVLEANRLGREGHYKDALAAFAEAEKLAPALPQLWLNKGYLCRQMLIPGGKTEGNRAAARCALAAFRRYHDLEPEDPRGEALTLQTLLDSGDFAAAEKILLAKVKRNPGDLGAVNALIDVYTRWDRLDQALAWYGARVGLLEDDPEAHDALATFVLARLVAGGGGPSAAAFDPRPDPKQPLSSRIPPGPLALDGQARIDLADLGIRHLEKALALRPGYPQGLQHMRELYIQKSFAFFADPPTWQRLVNRAEEWRQKAAIAK
jgi:tetratricopeptide (TPR) repeat protein